MPTVPVWYYKDDLEISEDDEEGWAPYPEAISKKIEKGFKVCCPAGAPYRVPSRPMSRGCRAPSAGGGGK